MPTNTPPPPRRQKTKGEPPTSATTKSNLTKPEPGKLVDLNFKVPAEFRKNFKIAAATQGKSQVDLLQEIFQFWSARNS